MRCVANTMSRPLYPRGKAQYPLYRGLVGSQEQSGLMRKISLPPGCESRTVHPVENRYKDYAIITHTFLPYIFLSSPSRVK